MFPCQRKSTRVFTALVSFLDWAVAVVWALVLLIDNCGDSRYDAPHQRPLPLTYLSPPPPEPKEMYKGESKVKQLNIVKNYGTHHLLIG